MGAWVLIVSMVTMSDTATALTSVPGFATEALCQEAGRKIQFQRKLAVPYVETFCVKQWEGK